MLKLKVADDPAAMPPVGEPPPIQLAPNAPPAVNVPNGGALTADMAKKFALLQETNEIPVVPAASFSAKPVM